MTPKSYQPADLAIRILLSILEEFEQRKSAMAMGCWTDGTALYSYLLPIACWFRGKLYLLDFQGSQTTDELLAALRDSFHGRRSYEVVDTLPLGEKP